MIDEGSRWEISSHLLGRLTQRDFIKLFNPLEDKNNAGKESTCKRREGVPIKASKGKSAQ
jgi:hypothetical protein